MRALEAAAIAGGQGEKWLMEEAGRGLARLVQELFSPPAAVVIFAGKGHNAGDAFVAARHWLAGGWSVVVRECFPRDQWRPLTRRNWGLIESRLSAEAPPDGRLLLVDGLLGLGAGGILRPPIREACQQLNTLRLTRHADTVAVDGPTGLDFDSGAADPDAVVADVTVTIAAAKSGFVADGAINHVGRLAVVPVPALTPPGDPASPTVLTPTSLRPFLPPKRSFDTHKGQAGRVTVVAGSRGLLGAARLAATAAARGGAGLVTLAVPEDLVAAAMAALPAEIMVRPYHQFSEISGWAADALAVGPGLGPRVDPSLVAWLRDEPRPMVIDADALNALARAGTSTVRFAAPRLLTPHPGEMQRLLSGIPAVAGGGLSRAQQARAVSDALGVTVLLKGARSVIASPGRPPAFNTTGHPGMASGGMGDVLTGLGAALLAQGTSPHEAACLGSWLLGRAAELALAAGSVSPESLLAGDGLAHLGSAFHALRFSDV